MRYNIAQTYVYCLFCLCAAVLRITLILKYVTYIITNYSICVGYDTAVSTGGLKKHEDIICFDLIQISKEFREKLLPIKTLPEIFGEILLKCVTIPKKAKL